MQFLYDFIDSFTDILKNFLSWLLDGLIIVVSGIFSVLMDIIFTIILSIINTAGSIIGSVNYGAAWAGVPPQMLYVLHQCGIDTALTMLGSVYLVRFLLNLIPAAFTRV